MASESSSQQQQKQISPTLNVNFELEDGIIAFGIALSCQLVSAKNEILLTDLECSFDVYCQMYMSEKKSKEAYKSLILPSGEVNTDDFADKSLSRTNVQPVTQSKAKTDKKSRKKKNLASSKQKTLKTIRESSLSPQVTYTQPAKDPEAIADATHSIDASELT
ncbi:hypothetical protein Tco_0658752 [Tanacetum coccineum]